MPTSKMTIGKKKLWKRKYGVMKNIMLSHRAVKSYLPLLPFRTRLPLNDEQFEYCSLDLCSKDGLRCDGCQDYEACINIYDKLC